MTQINTLFSEIQSENSKSNRNLLDVLHEQARSFLSQQDFDFDEKEFEETHDKEVIKFKSTVEGKEIKCWLKCSYPVRQNGTPGFCITYGAFHPELPQQDTKTFWLDESYELTEEERKAINERREEGRLRADKRAKEEKKTADEYADWCKEKFQNASERGFSPYFQRKGVELPSGIRYEIRKADGIEETIALIPLKNIKGEIRGLQEIYPSKRKIHEDDKAPRDKNTLGKYSGCFFTFGKLENGKPICVAEGYATAYSIFISTNITTLMVVARTNIDSVLKGIARKYKNSEIIICGDDDVDTQGNPGRTDAENAARKYRCKVVFPQFLEGKKRDEEGNAFKDFHDLMLIRCNDEVKRQVLENAIFPESTKPLQKEKRREVVKVPQNGLPIIQIMAGQIHNTTDQAERLLSKNNLGIFQRGGQLVRIIRECSKPKKNKLLDKDGNEIIKRSADALLIAEVDPIYLTELLGKYANWTRFDERSGKWVVKDCPERVARTLIARREWNIPILAGIIQAPTLRSDGSILEIPGYDEDTGLFFNAGDAHFHSIPHSPTKDDAHRALNFLLEPIKDFPFENKESKSVAISGILTSLIRKSIRSAPLHGYSAPKMGSGKSLLADVVGLIATGKDNCAIPQAENEAEEKKRLLSILAEGDPIICYDNIEHPFGSPALCSVLTQNEFKDRLLGQNRSLSVPTNATFLATGNQLTFWGDTSTRVILCRLDPQCERPEERSFDRDLRKYIPLNRGKLVCAALTILRAYHIAGRPKQNIAQFGRFEEWSDWVRSSLVWLDMADPCTTRKEIENSDPVRQSLGNLLTSWYETVGDLSMRVRDIIKRAQEPDNLNLLEALREITPKDSSLCPIKIGKKLKTFEKRIENGYRLQISGKSQNADLWKVTKI